MGLRGLVRALGGRLGRFNDSFGGTAAATGVQSPSGLGPRVDAASVVAVLGEIEREQGEAGEALNDGSERDR